MNKKRLFKFITFLFAIIWIIFLCSYTASIVGTLIHELTHQRYAIEPTIIEVNYDGSGSAISTKGFWDHSHQFVYFNGMIVEMTMMLITVIAILVILIYNYNDK